MIQPEKGLNSGLDEKQKNALEILTSLSDEEYGRVKASLGLGDPKLLDVATIDAFLARMSQRGLDPTDTGIDRFKEDHRLGNQGPLKGVIGPQTAGAIVSALLAQGAPVPTGGPRTTNQAGVDLIKGFEGLHELVPGAPGTVRAYRDPIGIPTIGYGHTKGVTMGTTITTAKAEELLRQDLRDAEGSVARLARVSLSDNEFSALVSFAFNCGAGNLASSTLLRELNSGNRSRAADEFLKWANAGGKRMAGLVKRREAERTLFLTS